MVEGGDVEQLLFFGDPLGIVDRLIEAETLDFNLGPIIEGRQLFRQRGALRHDHFAGAIEESRRVSESLGVVPC